MANSANARGGQLFLRIGGELQDAKGKFTYNLGKPKREPVVGADGTHGYKLTPQTAFIEGAITDRGSMDMKALLDLDGETVTLELANGKVIVAREAWYAGEGTVDTEEGEVPVRFESRSELEEVR